jgi:hypothetical protein
MRRATAAVFVLGLILALAPPATAATPSPKVMAAQIRTLQKQVKTLQRSLRQTTALAAAAAAYAGCSTAATADAFQSINAAVFTPVNDYQLCSGFRVTRQPGVQTSSVFQSLLNIFK